MITVNVFGIPAPQGSKRHVGNGIMIESSKKVRPWRQDVKYALLGEMAGSLGIIGPVRVEFTFTMPKPKSAPKRRKTYPDRAPDVDKLCRSTLDALVEAGAIEDDARVVELVARKVFPGEHALALVVPGASITITAARA